MGSWQPQYTDVDPSQERLAEMVLKLEREVYRTKRPRQLAKRDVFLRIGEPIDLGRFIPAYLRDSRAVRHGVAEQLRDMIQILIGGVLRSLKRQFFRDLSGVTNLSAPKRQPLAMIRVQCAEGSSVRRRNIVNPTPFQSP